MRGAELIFASCILAVSSASVASAQWVEPFKVLEEARRDRLELDKRLARDAAVRRQQEKAGQAGQANAQPNLDDGRTGAPASAATLNIPPTELEASSAREGVSGAPISPAPDPDAGSELAPSKQSLAPSPGAIAAIPIEPATRVLITVDKAAQRMRVTVDGNLRHSWPVSTGRARFETPAGTFQALRLAKVHYSKEWDRAPMPHSIFFTDRGHAIHGSNATRLLGRRASHGCVRLAPAQAAALFALVQAEGPSATKVTITDEMSAERLVRPRAVDARARKSSRVRRASSDAGPIGRQDGWTE